jgi:hypothetical protein
MGLFDIRCSVSRISTMWKPRPDRRRTHSMFLVEQLGGVWLPCTPPISGTYDRSGGIELWPEDRSEYTEWADERMWLLWETGALVSSWPEELGHNAHRDFSPLELLLHHGAQTAFNDVILTIDGRPCRACIVHDVVADAICSADPDFPRSVADTLATLFPDGGAGRYYFSDPPAAGLPQLRRYASVCHHVRARDGLTPIRHEDGHQHDDDLIRRSVGEARARDDPRLRRLLAPSDPDEAAAERALADALKSAVPRLYTPRDSFAVGDLIDHPKFGRGLVEAHLDGDKLRVRFPGDVRALVHRRA